jgi:exonuclease SbcC
MSLTRLQVTNFQSLKNVDIELGVFTVIVGPSSSGKSALIRAVKALASNVRGTTAVTRGQKALAITARTETHVVTLERFERSASYKINGGEGGNLTFTKLGGEVPFQVTDALRIEPVSEQAGSVNFAGQFDKPYLLDESGSVVARVLGELTNVNAIFEAVRAANRIRQNAASTVKMRQNDLERVKGQLGAFQGLQDRVKALAEAEEIDGRRQNLEAQIGRLSSALNTLRLSHRAVEKATLPPLPAYEHLGTVLNRYLDLQAQLRGRIAKQKRFEDVRDETATALMNVGSARNAITRKLEEAGVCPTCGQEIQGSADVSVGR